MPSETPRASARDIQGWRVAVEGYLTNDETEPHTADYSQLGLQFELRELIPRTAHRWNGPTSRAAGAKPRAEDGPGSGDYRLGVRPVSRTARSWSRGTLNWSSVPHLLNRLRLDPEQHRWFCEFAALHRATALSVPGSDANWVFLDEFQNPVLWTLLRQAEQLGVAFVGPTASAKVRIASQAQLSLDATAADGGIRLRSLLIIDGEEHSVGSAGAIGDHGVYAFDLGKPHRYVLAPTEQPLSAEQRAMLGGRSGVRESVTVPADGVTEFLRDYLPGIRGGITVASSDSSIALPSPPAAMLVLTATHGARQSLSLEWRWENSRRTEPSMLRAVLPDGVIPEDWLPASAEPGAVPARATLRGIDAAEFATMVLPRLAELTGVRVDVRGLAPAYRELTGTPHLSVTAVPTEKFDWFNLGVIVTVDDKEIPFVPLFRALAKGKKKLLLIDGSYLALNHPALEPLAELISEARDLAEWETRPHLSRHQTSLWADFEDLADEAAPAVEWRALLSEVREDAPTPIGPPQGLQAEFRPYQLDGFSWLAFLWRHQLGAILADDMGLGKTLQCLALIQHVAEQRAGVSAAEEGMEAARRPFLVVAPTSVVSNWVSEAARFTPNLVVREISATEAKTALSVAEAATGADIVVTSYALLRLDFDAYQAVARSSGWAGLILDEAQFVKNSASRVHECALELDVRFKLAVTGTPMENSLTEMHALFAIVAPGLFPSARRFGEEYVRPIESTPMGISRGRGAGSSPAAVAGLRSERLAKLRRRIRPFMLRRTKEIVASELPAKQEQTLSIELAPEHRDLYDVFLQRERQKLFGLLEDLDRNRFTVFRSLTLLRLLALDASLISEEHASIPSSKLDALFEQLDGVIVEGHRALVFSQFTSYLRKLATRLEAKRIPYVYLDGSTLKRSAVIDEFKNGTAPLFLISLKAGGFGLNLTEADYVFLLDPWWNPASEEQAIDRTHRIGQAKNVMVYRLIAADTIEEKVMALKQRKSALFDAVIDDEALFSSSLSGDDIRELLS